MNAYHVCAQKFRRSFNVAVGCLQSTPLSHLDIKPVRKDWSRKSYGEMNRDFNCKKGRNATFVYPLITWNIGRRSIMATNAPFNTTRTAELYVRRTFSRGRRSALTGTVTRWRNFSKQKLTCMINPGQHCRDILVSSGQLCNPRPLPVASQLLHFRGAILVELLTSLFSIRISKQPSVLDRPVRSWTVELLATLSSSRSESTFLLRASNAVTRYLFLGRLDMIVSIPHVAFRCSNTYLIHALTCFRLGLD